jgi:PAS domain S-box-containing protein
VSVKAASDPFQALAESCDGIVFVTDLTMRMLYASSALQRETGFTEADFQFPQQDNPFIHRDDAERVATTLAAFVASDACACEPIENRFLDRWGRTHRYHSIVTKVDFRGVPALLFALRSVDAPAAGTVDDRQYRALVELADDAILRIDNAGRILFANRRAHELLDHSATELGYLRLDDLVATSDRAALTDEITRSIASRDPVRFELRLHRKNRRSVLFQAVLTSLGSLGYTGELLAILRPDDRAVPATAVRT